MKDVGGTLSFSALNAALLFSLGATVGAFTLATAKLSLLLCPGTPSNILSFIFSTLSLAVLPCPGLPLSLSSSVKLLFLCPGGGFAGVVPNLKLAALVIRGAIVGAAVDATVIVSLRLCPGTFAKVCASLSFDGGVRATWGICTPPVFSSAAWFARRAAAFVVRGTMSGLAFDEGAGRALKPGFPFAFSLVLLLLAPLLLLPLPPTVEGLVALDGA